MLTGMELNAHDIVVVHIASGEERDNENILLVVVAG